MPIYFKLKQANIMIPVCIKLLQLLITRTPVLQNRTPTFIKQASLGPLNYLTGVKPCLAAKIESLKGHTPRLNSLPNAIFLC